MKFLIEKTSVRYGTCRSRHPDKPCSQAIFEEGKWWIYFSTLEELVEWVNIVSDEENTYGINLSFEKDPIKMRITIYNDDYYS